MIVSIWVGWECTCVIVTYEIALLASWDTMPCNVMAASMTCLIRCSFQESQMQTDTMQKSLRGVSTYSLLILLSIP